MKKLKAIFIHRSVGNNLLKDGDLRNIVLKVCAETGIDIDFKDINNNTTKGIPGDDTTPKDYAVYFKEHACDEDIVIIKSCYPNNTIDSDATLQQLKETYLEIAKSYLAKSKGKLLIMTTPPLRPIRTNSEHAKRAQTLAKWLSVQSFGKRVSVFDFYALLADDSGVLRKEYRRLLPWDNHPNNIASQSIAPKLASRIAQFIA